MDCSFVAWYQDAFLLSVGPLEKTGTWEESHELFSSTDITLIIKLSMIYYALYSINM